ncbi:MAG: protein arginine kinase [Chlamydiales bacterium]|jgi:protein arginine kinase
MKKNSKVEDVTKLSKPWVNNDNNIWIASTLKLYRNIAKFKFPAKLDSQGRVQSINIIKRALEKVSSLKDLTLIKAKDSNPHQKEFIYEHFLSKENYLHAHSGEAFILDDTGEVLLTINIRDHIHLQLTDCSNDLEETWNRLIKMEVDLGESIEYAFNSKFGFLSSDPEHCGTGLLAQIYMHVPALILTSQIDEILEKQNKKNVKISGLQSDETSLIGDIVSLHNEQTLGLTTDDIISTMHSAATSFLIAEKSCRTKIKNENSPEYRDKVSRAFGLLLHSYRLETQEALEALSLCKLGIDLEWIKSIDHKDINNLFFSCRRAHLQGLFEEEVSKDQLPEKRSELVKSILKKAKLVAISTKGR